MDVLSERRRRDAEERIARKLGVDRAQLALPEWPNTDDRYAAHCALHEMETRVMELAVSIRLPRLQPPT